MSLNAKSSRGPGLLEVSDGLWEREVDDEDDYGGELGGVMTDGYGQTKAGASATTKINRHDFGVNWNAALEAGGLTLGEEVSVAIELQVVLQP